VNLLLLQPFEQGEDTSGNRDSLVALAGTGESLSEVEPGQQVSRVGLPGAAEMHQSLASHLSGRPFLTWLDQS
jgi:hypothetical protein